MKEIENYVEAFERIEERIVDDNKFPVVKGSKITKVLSGGIRLYKTSD